MLVTRLVLQSSVVSRNIVVNAFSQVWAMALGILALPLYLKLMGPAYYGLIGFGMTIQIIVNLVDAGFSPALGRNIARMRAGLEDPEELALFLRTLDWAFFAIVATFCVAGTASMSWWASNWFGVSGSSAIVVGQSMALVIASSALRCMAALYRGAIVNLEKQIFTSGMVVIVNAVRLLLPLPFVALFPDPRIVFAIWLGAAFLEVIVLRVVLSRNIPMEVPLRRFSIPSLRRHLAFTGGVALLALIHTLATQYDKLLLSRILTLQQYGYFSLAVVLSGAMLTLPAAIVQAIQPRVTGSISAQDVQAKLISMSTELIVAFAVAPAVAIACLPRTALQAWVNDPVAIGAVSPYLGFYVVGSALVGISSAAFMLQIAAGRMRMHIVANLLLVAALIPLAYFAATHQGALGTARVWFVLNTLFVTIYGPFAIGRLLPGRGLSWLIDSVAIPIGAAVLGALLVRWTFSDIAANRIAAILHIVLAGCVAVGFAAIAAKGIRASVKQMRGALTVGSGVGR